MGKARKKIWFGGEDNFNRSYEKSQVVVLPLPYERTTTYQKGTKKGPRAILEASENMELYDEELDREIFQIGIYTLPPLNITAKKPEPAIKQIEKKVAHIIKEGKLPVILGGEHTITVGAVSAFKKKYKKLTVVQLDAHADLRNQYLGSRFNHACTMARVLEQYPVVQIGIRSMSAEEGRMIRGQSGTVKKSPHMYRHHGRKENWILFASDMTEPGWIGKILSKIDGPVYLTIDLDYFDPSIMPAVGTPEPGGLRWYPTLRFLKRLSKKTRILGFDLVELCPRGNNLAPDFLAAKLAYKLLGYIFYERAKNAD
jgi:agmatinase